jgi:hypothetical protein
VEEGLRAERLVTDERFASLLARCPDPLDGGPSGSLGVEPSPDERERDLSALEFDAMHVLARTSRWLMVNRDRNRERMAKLIEQRDAAQAEAPGPRRRRRRRFHPWRRLRSAFGR